MLVNIQKKDKGKDFEKRVTNVICMIVIMTDCCLSFYEAQVMLKTLNEWLCLRLFFYWLFFILLVGEVGINSKQESIQEKDKEKDIWKQAIDAI